MPSKHEVAGSNSCRARQPSTLSTSPSNSHQDNPALLDRDGVADVAADVAVVHREFAGPAGIADDDRETVGMEAAVGTDDRNHARGRFERGPRWPAPKKSRTPGRTPRPARAARRQGQYTRFGARLRDQLAGVHDAERVERLLDRAQGVDAAGRREAGELGALQLADAVLGRDRAAGGGDEVVDQAGDAARPRPRTNRRRRGRRRGRGSGCCRRPNGRSRWRLTPGKARSTSAEASTMKRGMSATGTEMSWASVWPFGALGFGNGIADFPEGVGLGFAGGDDGVARSMPCWSAAPSSGFELGGDVVRRIGRRRFDQHVPRMIAGERRARAGDVLEDESQRILRHQLEPLDRCWCALRGSAAGRARGRDCRPPAQATARAAIAGTSRSATAVTTPSVPSAPISNWSRL